MTEPNDAVVEIDGRRYFKRDAVLGNPTDPEAMLALQKLADDGHIKLTHYWCSEIGYVDAEADGGHFHSGGSVHLPHKFEMVIDPGAGWETLWVEPFSFKIPLKNPEEQPDGREEEDQRSTSARSDAGDTGG